MNLPYDYGPRLTRLSAPCTISYFLLHFTSLLAGVYEVYTIMHFLSEASRIQEIVFCLHSCTFSCPLYQQLHLGVRIFDSHCTFSLAEPCDRQRLGLCAIDFFVSTGPGY